MIYSFYLLNRFHEKKGKACFPIQALPERTACPPRLSALKEKSTLMPGSLSPPTALAVMHNLNNPAILGLPNSTNAPSRAVQKRNLNQAGDYSAPAAFNTPYFVPQNLLPLLSLDSGYGTKASLCKNTHAQPGIVLQATRMSLVTLSISIPLPMGMNRRCSGGYACVLRAIQTPLKVGEPPAIR